MEPRAEDLALIATFRRSRETAVQKSAQRSLRHVLLSQNEGDQLVYVMKLLDVHPVLGKVAGRRLLDTLGLSHFTRVGELSSHQVAHILKSCEEAA